MSCTHPLRGFPTGRMTDKGKMEIFVSGTTDQMIPAYEVEKRFGHRQLFNLTDWIELPCGHCYECKKAYAYRWSVRCAAESLDHDQNYFATLTYNEENNPGKLDKRDLQNFFKRLRKSGFNFRYFACGEYGETFHRPHFHVLFFGLDLAGKLVPWSRSGNFMLYRCPALENVWYKGFVMVGYADSAAVGGYVAKYVMKNQGIWKEPTDAPSFLTMSRRPGIGFNALPRLMDDYGALIVPSGSGKALKSSIPKSYREKNGVPSDPNRSAAIIDKLINTLRSAGYSPEEIHDFFNIERYREQFEYTDALKSVKKKI